MTTKTIRCDECKKRSQVPGWDQFGLCEPCRQKFLRMAEVGVRTWTGANGRLAVDAYFATLSRGLILGAI